jgi:hypothetical protein
MNIQSFIFNWKGNTDNVLRLERAIEKLSEVNIINSDESMREARRNWIQLDDSAFFSAQWNKALDIFNADVLFHVQADVEFNEFERLFERACAAFRSHPIGIYEPKIDRPRRDYDLSKLRMLRDNVFEVPATDCTCWFVAAPVLSENARIDERANKYGWGVAATIAALCRRRKLLCVRDYEFLVHHPDGRGYSTTDAVLGRVAHINSLTVDLAVDTLQVIYDAQRFKTVVK